MTLEETIRNLRSFEGAMSYEILNRTTAFLRALPKDGLYPELSVDPDGEMCLDWAQSAHHMFSVSIGKSPRLAYVWTDGTDRGCGVATFDGKTIPLKILQGIKEITKWHYRLPEDRDRGFFPLCGPRIKTPKDVVIWVTDIKSGYSSINVFPLRVDVKDPEGKITKFIVTFGDYVIKEMT